MWIFPTWYTDKWSTDATDKVWASDGSTNFNINVDNIWDRVFTDRTTDDLSEWTTNKYASTTNVNNAWAVMNTDTSTADMSFVIDEDDMASDSDEKVPTQQSVKAYVDTTVSVIEQPTTRSTFVAWENLTIWNALWVITETQQMTTFSTNYFNVWDVTNDTKLSQTLYFDKDVTLSNLSIYLKKTWTPFDNLTVRIETTSAWLPTWTLADANATTSICGTALTTSNALYNLLFAWNFTLTAWAVYAIVVSRSWSVSWSNYYQIVRSDSNVYTRWTAYLYNGSSWSSQSYDINFSLLGIVNDNKIYKINATTTNIKFKWFATNTVNSWENVVVDTAWISNTQTWLVFGADYYLSDTSGVITTSVTSNLFKVWRAVSNTKILINTSYNSNIYADWNWTFYWTTNTAYESWTTWVLAWSDVNASSYVTAKQVTSNFNGLYTITAIMSSSVSNLLQSSAKLYKNWTLMQQIDWTYNSWWNLTATFTNFPILKWDILRLDVKVIQARYPSNNETLTVNSFNFKYNTLSNQTFFS